MNSHGDFSRTKGLRRESTRLLRVGVGTKFLVNEIIEAAAYSTHTQAPTASRGGPILTTARHRPKCPK